jgi:succinoglycan biosynthesis transport protein ExoP
MNETDTSAIFAPLWRRKWLILAVALIVAAGSYLYYKHQTPLYQASTQIYLGAGAEEQFAGERASEGNRSSSSATANQVAVLNQIVIPSARRNFRRSGNAAAARGRAKAKAAEKSLFITIIAEAHKAKATALIANTVAQDYLRRQHANRRRAINIALAITRRQLRRLELSSVRTTSSSAGSKSGGGSGAANVLQEASLSSKINQLEASLAVSGAQQVTPATPDGARQLSPKPRHNAIFGFAIGFLLACVAAYVFSRLDRRLRTLRDIEAVFGAQIITALPRVRRPVVDVGGIRAPSKNLLEPLRRLHAAVRVRPVPGSPNNASAPERPRCRVVLMTSAEVGDGKSTVLADLALVQRDAGERVAVIDANLRRPVLARLLGVHGGEGLTEVLTGELPIEEAMQRVQPASPAAAAGTGSQAGVATVARGTGALALVASGAAGANPPALLAGESMEQLLRSLTEDFDLVLIDGPSPLEVSDVMPLLSRVDGVIVVARLGHTRQASARRLAQLLGADSSAPVLGVVANCVPPAQIQRYGLASHNGAGWARKLTGR